MKEVTAIQQQEPSATKKPKAAKTEATKPAAKNNSSMYLNMLQASINADIHAAKVGALDEELLRSKMLKDVNPNSIATRVNLWLCALVSGVIDDVEIEILESDNGPDLEVYPTIGGKNSQKAAVLQLQIPGPAKPVVRVEPHQAGDDARLVAGQ